MKLEAGTITDTSHSGGGDSVQHTVSRNMGKLTRTESVHLSNRRSSKWNYEKFTPFMLFHTCFSGEEWQPRYYSFLLFGKRRRQSERSKWSCPSPSSPFVSQKYVIQVWNYMKVKLIFEWTCCISNHCMCWY